MLWHIDKYDDIHLSYLFYLHQKDQKKVGIKLKIEFKLKIQKYFFILTFFHWIFDIFLEFS